MTIVTPALELNPLDMERKPNLELKGPKLADAFKQVKTRVVNFATKVKARLLEIGNTSRLEQLDNLQHQWDAITTNTAAELGLTPTLDQALVADETDKNNVGLDRAGRVKHYYDGPSHAWNLLTMLARGLDRPELNTDILLHKDVSNDYVVNVIHDLITAGMVPKIVQDEDWLHIHQFSEQLKRALPNKIEQFTSYQHQLAEVVEVLTNYSLMNREFFTENHVPTERVVPQNGAYLPAFSLPDIVSELSENAIYKDDVRSIVKIVSKYIDYKEVDGEVTKRKREGIVRACKIADAIFSRETVTIQDIMALHRELIGDHPKAGQIDHSPQALRRKGTNNLEGEIEQFLVNFNRNRQSINPNASQEEVRRIAVSMMQEWEAIHPTHDASGRVSRFIANAIFQKAHMPLIPVILRNKWDHRLVLEKSKNNLEELQSFWKQNSFLNVYTWQELSAHESIPIRRDNS